MLRTGELDLQQYNHAMERLVVSRRIGALLVELGYLQPDELMRAAERQASAIVLNAMSYRTGSYTIEFNSEFPDEIITLPLATERLLLDGVHRIEYWSLITRGLGRMTRMFEQTPGADTRSYSIELNDEEGHVLSLLQQPGTVEDLCGRSYLPNFVDLPHAVGAADRRSHPRHGERDGRRAARRGGVGVRAGGAGGKVQHRIPETVRADV